MIDFPLEISWFNLHDSFGDIRVKSFKTPLVLSFCHLEEYFVFLRHVISVST